MNTNAHAQMKDALKAANFSIDKDKEGQFFWRFHGYSLSDVVFQDMETAIEAAADAARLLLEDQGIYDLAHWLKLDNADRAALIRLHAHHFSSQL